MAHVTGRVRAFQVHVSDEALDRALRPFYLLPSPQQEKDKVRPTSDITCDFIGYGCRQLDYFYIIMDCLRQRVSTMKGAQDKYMFAYEVLV